MNGQNRQTKTGAAVYGDPGDRARLAGLMRALGPVLLGVALAGAAFGLLAVRPAAAGAVLLLAAATFWVAARRSAARVRAFFKGARGEERVAAVLATLPPGFAVFHGVDGGPGMRLAARGDIDHIVIGPAGVWVVETKCWDGRVDVDAAAGAVLFEGAPPSRNPVQQAARLTARVAEALARRLPAAPPVRALLCFAGSGFAGGLETVGGVTVCGIDRLHETVAAATGAAGLTEDDRTRIVEILKQAL